MLYKKKKEFNDASLNEPIASVNHQNMFWAATPRVQNRKIQSSNNITSDVRFNYFKYILENDIDTEEDDIFHDDNESFFNRPISRKC